jgi:hypothetical protein
VARKHDGTAVAWGDGSFGGDASSVDLTNIGDVEAQTTTETMASSTWTTTTTNSMSSSTTTAGMSPVQVFFVVGGIGAALPL